MPVFRQSTPLPLIHLPGGPYAEKPRPLVACALGAALAVAAFVVTAVVPPLAERSTFLLSFAAVVASVWTGGWRAGFVATALTVVLTTVFLLSPSGSVHAIPAGDLIRLTAFVVVASSVTAFGAIADDAIRRLHLSQELSRVVVENAPALVAGADEDGNTIVFNRACEELTGYAREQVVGRPFIDTFVPPAWRGTVAARFRDNPIEELAAPHENPWMTKSAAERTIEWRCFRVRSADGTWITLGIGQDVTDRRAAEDAVQQALLRERRLNEIAESANRSKERFIATLSHELRSPLNAALGWLQTLRVSGSAAHHDRGLTIIERNLQLMAGLIEDVADYSRIELGKLTLRQERIDLPSFLQAALATAKPAAERAAVTLRLDAASDLPVIIGDEKRLQQTILNLLNNAIKFTPSGGEVAVSAVALGDDGLELSVRDTGIGIPVDVLPNVFRPFWQAESDRNSAGSMGIGLALVKELTEAHGGTVSIHSNGPGTGTRVTLRLPLPAREDQQLAG